MATTETTTTCDLIDCDAEQEQGLRDNLSGRDLRLCVRHAIDVYDAIDPARKGGRIELFDLA